MLSKQVILTSALTLAVALGIGAYMQAAGSGWLGGSVSALEPELPRDPDTVQLRLDKITLTSAPPAADRAETAPHSAEPVPAVSCPMTAIAEAAAMAMVKLTVSAPCHALERLTVHHSGMSFTAALDSSGRFTAQVPALARRAVFITETTSGGSAVAAADVEGLETIERVVLHWSGNSGFEIHAREFGAAYGGAGHVWHGAAAQAGAGRIDRLGSGSQLEPRFAEFYSLPTRLPGRSGSVALSAEAEVTGLNCGRDISIQALQLSGGRLSSRDLMMVMPDCNETGSFLVLNNLLEDLKITAN